VTCLHLLSKSSASGLPRQAGRTFAPGDGLLLLGDGVYCLREPRELAALTDNIKLYALAPDLRARGLENQGLENQDLEDPGLEKPGFKKLDFENQGLEDQVSAGSLAEGVAILDHDGFVALCAEYDKTLSWF